MLAWGVLNKGEASNQLLIRLNSLLGASMTRDAKAIPLIIDALRGTNSLIRAAAVQLAAQYGDFPLQDEISRLLKEETVWSVRLELIRAVGQLRMENCKEQLIQILGNPRTLAEEKAASIISLVNMMESIGNTELAQLIRSDRAGLRELACQIIVHLNLSDRADMLLPLLRDPNASVRMSALNALALLGVDKLDGRPLMQVERITRLMKDSAAEVAITASWLALLNKDKRGEKALKAWIQNKEPKYARLAAGALAISGNQGVGLAKKILKKSSDPYVRCTLAVGLIGQREWIEKSCKIIDEHLTMSEKWMWDTSINPLFRALAPSQISHTSQTPNYPQVINQLTRLELLQILCIMGYPRAQDSIKGFLRTNAWGPVGAAAVTLLQEGDDGALEVVRCLLKDPEGKIRTQAALILAMLGGDKQAIGVLKELYPEANREIKLHILEAIAKVGDPESIEFLLERLHEPFQVLRVVAATAIIQCLYH